ncbi:RNA polymerase sigma factor [Microbacterium tumbae]
MAARSQAARAAGILSARSAEREATRRRVFDQIFTSSWSAVARHTECYIESDPEVHEVVAEVFQLAWERLRPSRPGGLPWLLRLSDGVLSGRRRRGPVRAPALDAVHRNVVTGGSNASSVGRQDVIRAMARLTEPERRIVVLMYWDGLSIEEAGEAMRRRPGAVRATLRRAREKLRAELEGGASGDDVG